jgi:hypothetical protein
MAHIALPVVPKIAMSECSSCGGGAAAEAVTAAGPAHLGGGSHFMAAIDALELKLIAGALRCRYDARC